MVYGHLMEVGDGRGRCLTDHKSACAAVTVNALSAVVDGHMHCRYALVRGTRKIRTTLFECICWAVTQPMTAI